MTGDKVMDDIVCGRVIDDWTRDGGKRRYRLVEGLESSPILLELDGRGVWYRSRLDAKAATSVLMDRLIEQTMPLDDAAAEARVSPILQLVVQGLAPREGPASTAFRACWTSVWPSSSPVEPSRWCR